MNDIMIIINSMGAIRHFVSEELVTNKLPRTELYLNYLDRVVVNLIKRIEVLEKRPVYKIEQEHIMHPNDWPSVNPFLDGRELVVEDGVVIIKEKKDGKEETRQNDGDQ